MMEFSFWKGQYWWGEGARSKEQWAMSNEQGALGKEQGAKRSISCLQHRREEFILSRSYLTLTSSYLILNLSGLPFCPPLSRRNYINLLIRNHPRLTYLLTIVWKQEWSWTKNGGLFDRASTRFSTMVHSTSSSCMMMSFFKIFIAYSSSVPFLSANITCKIRKHNTAVIKVGGKKVPLYTPDEESS